MERYKLNELFTTLDSFKNGVCSYVVATGLMNSSEFITSNPVAVFICNAIYNYYFDDYIKYTGGVEEYDVPIMFLTRMCYDIAVKYPYWKRKYEEIQKMFSIEETNLLQTSRMKSTSQENIDSAGGVVQKSASTPTGVNTSTDTGDDIDISAESNYTTDDEEPTSHTGTLEVSVGSSSFADKYTNYQGKTTTGSKTSGNRSGDVLREGSPLDLIKVLEKMPSSFADEITREVSKHFEIVYSY